MTHPTSTPPEPLPEHEARQRGAEDASRGVFNQRMANDPLNGPAYRGGFDEGRRVDGIYTEIRRWLDGPDGVAPPGVPPLDTARIDPNEYKVDRDHALHAGSCADTGSCAGCSPIDHDEARRRGYQTGAHRGPVDGTLATNRRYGAAFLDGLREGRADALANAGWREARIALDAERAAADLDRQAAALTSDGYTTPAKVEAAEDLLTEADRLRGEARTLLASTDDDQASEALDYIEQRTQDPPAADTHRVELEDNVLAAARQLDPADHSVEAEQVRQTAASIEDHREMDARRAVWDAADALGVTAPPMPSDEALQNAAMTRTQYLETQAEHLRRLHDLEERGIYERDLVEHVATRYRPPSVMATALDELPSRDGEGNDAASWTSQPLILESERDIGEMDPHVAGSEAAAAYYWENGGEYPEQENDVDQDDEATWTSQTAEPVAGEVETGTFSETITYMAINEDGQDVRGQITVPHVVNRRLGEQLAAADAAASSPNSEITAIEVISHLDTDGREISAWQLFDEETGVMSEEAARGAFSETDAAALWDTDTRPEGTLAAIDDAIVAHEAQGDEAWGWPGETAQERRATRDAWTGHDPQDIADPEQAAASAPTTTETDAAVQAGTAWPADAPTYDKLCAHVQRANEAVAQLDQDQREQDTGQLDDDQRHQLETTRGRGAEQVDGGPPLTLS